MIDEFADEDFITERMPIPCMRPGPLETDIDQDAPTEPRVLVAPIWVEEK